MSRLIAVSNGVYDSLQKIKSKGESFSEVIIKMMGVYKGKKREIGELAGILKDKDVSEWLTEVEEGRKRSFKRKIGQL